MSDTGKQQFTANQTICQLCEKDRSVPDDIDCDVVFGLVYRNERNSVLLGWRKSLLWNRLFQNIQILHAFVRHYSNTKMNFPKGFSKVFKWQNDFMQ